ncbi:MAG: hypothetical protein OES09_17690 [Gammaproteobacteria bacterium]|nr:hypothetical protein [Gammaproteobacteria bacterium]
MNILRTVVIAFALFLAACANHEGQYEPACIAYEGDKIGLKGGHFKWHRFTDERKVDDSGNVKKPFPEFPKEGTYTLSDSRIEFQATDGTPIDDRILVEHAGERYLLTSKQHNVFMASNDMPECALKFTRTDR